MDKETLKQMNLHEQQDLDHKTLILRVPGGWVYKFYEDEYGSSGYLERRLKSTCFVREAVYE